MWMNRTAPGHARLVQYGDAMMAVEHVKAVRIASMYPYLMVAVPCLPRGWEVIVSLLPACFRITLIRYRLEAPEYNHE